MINVSYITLHLPWFYFSFYGLAPNKYTLGHFVHLMIPHFEPMFQRNRNGLMDIESYFLNNNCIGTKCSGSVLTYYQFKGWLAVKGVPAAWPNTETSLNLTPKNIHLKNKAITFVPKITTFNQAIKSFAFYPGTKESTAINSIQKYMIQKQRTWSTLTKIVCSITCFVVLHVYILLYKMQLNRQVHACDLFKQVTRHT